MGPKDIQSLAKEVFHHRIEKNEQKLEKKKLKAIAMNELVQS